MLERHAKAWRRWGRRAIVVQNDHGYENQVQQMFASALNAFGHIDILMTNAGVDASGTYVADLAIDDFQETMRRNLIGPLICCKHFTTASGTTTAAAAARF